MLTISTLVCCGMAALAAGFIDAISGGGGLLTIPMLLLCGVPPHLTLGTNKVSACCGTLAALLNFSRSHLVNWRVVFYGIGFSILGSWIGSLLALYLSSEVLGKVLIFLLPVGIIGILLPKGNRTNLTPPTSGYRLWLATPLICFVIGCYDGFFGPATGSFLILALYLFVNLNLIEASATAKAFNLGSNVSAAVSFVLNGVVVWPIAIVMGICFIIGNLTGSQVAIKIGSKVVRYCLFVSLALLMISLIWKYFFSS